MMRLSWILFVVLLAVRGEARVCMDVMDRYGAASIALPLVHQTTDYTCGPSALHSVLQYWKKSSPGELGLAQKIGTNATIGTLPEAMAAGARSFGLRVDLRENMTVADLRQALQRRESVILLITAWGDGHWVVLQGMDARNAWLMDPWVSGSYYRLPLTDLVANWRDVRAGREYRRLGLRIVDPATNRATGLDSGSLP